MNSIKLLIATHRAYQMPSDTITYIPVHVGAAGKDDLGYQRDDEGENISLKNDNYCELTALYWGWKNVTSDYLGLVHYRRYFAKKGVRYKEGMRADDVVLSKNEIEQYLQKADILVPKKRKYWIESLYSHYANTLDKTHLDKTREIIAQMHPEQLSVYDRTMKQTSGYMFNMFIMKKEYVNAYCQWLFPILDELYLHFDVTQMTPFHARYVGRVSELLFNVWLNVHAFNVVQLPVIYMEKVNWWVKGTAFLKAKFFKKKYDKSF